MTTVRTVIHGRRIEIRALEDLSDGTKVVATVGTDSTEDDSPMASDEIAYVLSAMRRIQPMEISDDMTADLDAWERKLNQYGIDHASTGIEGVYQCDGSSSILVSQAFISTASRGKSN